MSLHESENARKGTPETVLECALTAHRAGICVVPVRSDGSKQPDLPTWKQYQKDRPDLKQVKGWFLRARQGMGVVCGGVSGGLEVLDFESALAFDQWCEVLLATGNEPLLRKLLRGYVERSPKGRHVLFRCGTFGKGQKLAHAYERDESGALLADETGEYKKKLLIEVLGEGDYCIVAPSHGGVHPSGKPYERVAGSLSTITPIEAHERQILFDAARTLDDIPPQTEDTEEHTHYRTNGGGDRPGDIFNRVATWEMILEPHRWVKVGSMGEAALWRRPGKDSGHSATTNWKGNNCFHPFTTSTIFPADRSYKPFSVYTYLNHNKDFDAAVDDLMRQGYYQGGPRDDSGYGASHSYAHEHEDEDSDEDSNARTPKEERPGEDPWPCPSHLWRGVFAKVAEKTGRSSWEVWLGVLVAIGARAERNIDLLYHRRLYGMVYGLLIKGTGLGKGVCTDMFHIFPLPLFLRLAGHAASLGSSAASICTALRASWRNRVAAYSRHAAVSARSAPSHAPRRSR